MTQSPVIPPCHGIENLWSGSYEPSDSNCGDRLSSTVGDVVRVDLLEVAEVVHPLRHPVGDDDDVAAARFALVEQRLQLAEELEVAVDVLDVLDRGARLLLELRDRAVLARVDVARPVGDRELALDRAGLGGRDLLLAGAADGLVAAARRESRASRAGSRSRSRASSACSVASLARLWPPIPCTRWMCSGAQRQAHAGAAARQAAALGLVRVRDEDGHRHVARRAARRSGSRCPGRRRTRPSPRPTASRRGSSPPCVRSASFSGRTTAWQRSPVTRPFPVASISTPASSRTRVRSPRALLDDGGHQVRDADEPGHEGRRRALVDGLGLVHLLDLAAVHHRDPVGHRERLLLVVRHVDERDADLALDPLQLHLQALAELQVEGAERLVEQQDLGQVDQRAGQRDPLLHAAGELIRPAVGLGRPGRPARAPRGPAARSRPRAPSCA